MNVPEVLIVPCCNKDHRARPSLVRYTVAALLDHRINQSLVILWNSPSRLLDIPSHLCEISIYYSYKVLHHFCVTGDTLERLSIHLDLSEIVKDTPIGVVHLEESSDFQDVSTYQAAIIKVYIEQR